MTDEKLRLGGTNADSLLAAAGLTVTSVIEGSDPNQMLCAEAESWGADRIFVGAKSTAVWNAPCSAVCRRPWRRALTAGWKSCAPDATRRAIAVFSV